MKISKNRWAINIAIEVGRASTCKKNKVGSVIIDNYGAIVSTGKNGTPRGTDNTCECEDVTYQSTLHSEINCLLYAKRDVHGFTLYCTLSPCLSCSAAIIQSGISKVYFLRPYRDQKGVEYLRKYGVKVRQLCYKDLLKLNNKLR